MAEAGYPVPWHVQHYSCDPDDRSCYWFGSERCQTLDELLEWNVHLMSKTWICFTDWARFLQRVTGSKPLSGKMGAEGNRARKAS